MLLLELHTCDVVGNNGECSVGDQLLMCKPDGLSLNLQNPRYLFFKKPNVVELTGSSLIGSFELTTNESFCFFSMLVHGKTDTVRTVSSTVAGMDSFPPTI